ncbi:olfactory receptor 6C75-like [Trichechus manatus latirostris]|uniref:Olfactory receptor 6C75-like n=1 Tax=Trichechus manatus latirostris TaxID=127582 RepID=A0A2Y9ECR1_TRIMA|nr:olfactory receptor 6C75-like [Trichechus manatus latirostris]
MEMINGTAVQEFILEGFPAVQHLGKVLFLVHLRAYLGSITGNMVIITFTWADHPLETPMFVLLSYFSFCKCFFITTVVPKLLSIFLLGRQTIPFIACVIQAFSFLYLGSTIAFFRGVMFVDWYLATCNPLHYSTITNLRVCVLCWVLCYTLSFIFIIGLAMKVSQLSFCGPNVIPHFFCDIGLLTHLSCSNTHSFETYVFFIAIFVILISLLIAIITYSHIVVTIVHLPSTMEQQKAFCTCSFYHMILSLMYSSCVFIYLKPKQTNRLDSNREAALVNTVVTPLLNPVIYTLRNKQVHQALKGTLSRVKLQK